jgi:hypothetical protein
MQKMGISQYALYVNFFSGLISCTVVYKLIDYFWPTSMPPTGTMNLLLILPLLQVWTWRKQLRDKWVFDKTFFMVLLIYACLFGLISIHLFKGALPNFFAIAVGLFCGITLDFLVKAYKAYRARGLN